MEIVKKIMYIFKLCVCIIYKFNVIINRWKLFCLIYIVLNFIWNYNFNEIMMFICYFCVCFRSDWIFFCENISEDCYLENYNIFGFG